MQRAEAIVRVMLVEDSAVVRGMVRKWLAAVPGVEVVSSAGNGQVAIDMAKSLQPDVIILDIEMPVMDGLTALPEILKQAPAARVIIASTLSRRNAEVTLKAMSLGASDFVLKPSFAHEGEAARVQFQEELVRKVTGLGPRRGLAARAVAASGNNWTPPPPPGTQFRYRPVSSAMPRVLALGSSTGGPAALTRVFEDARQALGRVPVLVAQHMPATFTALLGDKLASLAGLSGGEAQDGEPVVRGRLYVAPGGKHMRVRQNGEQVTIVLDGGPPINHCRPAVDPLFQSVAEVYGPAALAAVLTGMGSDGTRGAVEIADAGGTVFVQDEASSVVWGMPGAAAASGAAAGQVSLPEMGARLARTLREGGHS